MSTTNTSSNNIDNDDDNDNNEDNINTEPIFDQSDAERTIGGKVATIATPAVTAAKSTKNKSSTNKKGTSADKNEFMFSEDEFDLYNKTTKEMNIDRENHTDIKQTPNNPKPLTGKELDKVINDPNHKVTIPDRGKTPSIYNTLGNNDKLGAMTKENIKTKEQEMADRRDVLIYELSSKDYIRLDLKVGMKEGKSVFVNQTYWFNSVSKQEEFHIVMKLARVDELKHKYAAIVNTPVVRWTEQDRDFMPLSRSMIEIAAYQVGEFEAFIRLGMPPEDYARVDTDQYKLALDVMGRRNTHPSV